MKRGIKSEVWIGLAGFGLAVLGGGLSPWLTPFDPWAPLGRPYAPPGWPHLLGTNDLGQDLLSEVLCGMRVSLLVGLAAAGLATAIGTGLGLVAGYFRGIVDEAIMGIADTLMLIPALPLIIVLVAYTGPGFSGLIAVIGLLWWTGTARAVRARVLQVRETPFVEAARALGCGHFRVLCRHVLPNVLSVVLARFITAVPEAILTEAGLSFLGLGNPAEKSLGLTLHYAFSRGGLVNGQWWWYTFPVLAIAFIVLSITLLGLGIEEDG